MSNIYNSQKSKSGYTLPKFIVDLHLWLGVGSGLILFLVCLSGTILVFFTEILHTADKDLYQITHRTGQMIKPLDSLILTLETKNKGFHVNSVTVPADKNEAWLFSMSPVEKRPAGLELQKTVPAKKGIRGRGFDTFKQYLVDPYSGKVQGNAITPTYKFMFFVLLIHRFLLLGAPGKIAVGIATLIFVVLLFSGLILWLPKKLKGWINWKRGLSIKWKANWKRINHDLHNTLGFYSFVLVFLMAMSGLYFSFDWYRTGWNTLMSAETSDPSITREHPVKSAFSVQKRAAADRYLRSAEHLFPYQGNLVLSLPVNSSAAISLSKTRTGFFASAGTDKAMLDPYTLRTLKLDRFRDKHFGQQVTDMVYPIHTGGVFGMSTKILYFIACLIATTLPITGVIIWLNKIKKKSGNAKRTISDDNLNVVV